MHKLDRENINLPDCLNNYRHGRDEWAALTYEEREEIRSALELMQGRRCAYCECGLDDHGQHIEHFRQRGRYPQGTFDWSNLFLSCERHESCGKHKDRCGQYDYTDLIKPDVEDPEYFLLFANDGTIAVRRGLTAIERRRAEETLRIFNLDEQGGPLRYMRKAAVSGYIKTAQEIQDIANYYPQEDWMPFLMEEIEQSKDLPFCTAIKHALTPQGM